MAARKHAKSLDFEKLRSTIKLRHFSSERKLHQKHPSASQFWQKAGIKPGKIREHAQKLITAGALAGSVLLTATPGVVNLNVPLTPNQAIHSVAPGEVRRILAEEIRTNLPNENQWSLNQDQEERISKALEGAFGIKASAELDGNRLNNAYGRMGAEQHLPRYPGDTVSSHESLVEKGITPGKGAWGYFASSRDQMTPEIEAQEKYYVAVQTLYLPEWNTDTEKLRNWYKYRKVVVVNPKNGKTIVADIADAGPSQFTGKQFGGSPEVIEYLGIDYGMQNHPVVLFFLDDKDNKVPLGPLEYNVSRDLAFEKS